MSRINSHMTRLQSVTERSSGSMKRFTSSFAGLAGAIGVTAALAGSMMLVKNSIGSAFDRIDTMERFERTMTTMLGTSEKAKAALEGLSAVVDGTAYGLDTAARSVQNFVSRGIEVNKATRWFDAIGDAIAFYGDGSNEQLEGVSSAMSKMLSSGKVSMQQMETLYIAGIDGPGIYAKAVCKSTAEVQKALSSGKVSAEDFFDVVTTAMLEGTNGVQKIAGTAKEAGATWAGAIANMKFAVVRGVTTIIQSIDELLANNGLPSLRDMVTAFGKKFESVLKGAAGAIQPFINKAKGIYKALKPYAAIFKEVAVAVGIFVGAMFAVNGVIGIIGGLAGAIAFLSGPIGIAVMAVAGLALGFRALYKNSDSFRAFVDGIVTAAKGLFKVLTGDTKGGLSDMLNGGLDSDAVGRVMSIASGIKSGVQRIKDVMGALGSGNMGDLAAALGFSPEMQAKISGFTDSVKTMASEFVTYLGAKWQEIQPFIDVLIARFASMKDTAIAIFTSLWGFLSPIILQVGNVLQILGDIAVMVFNNVIAPAIDFAISMFQALWQLVGPILELLGAAIGAAFEILKVAWDTILKPVAEWLLGAFAEAFESAKKHVDNIAEAFGWLGDKISGAVDWFKSITDAVKNFKVPDWLSRLGGGGTVKFEEAKADGSHFHGLARVPTDNYMARLHKGEKVLTRQEADAYDGINYETAAGGNTYDNRKYDYSTVNQSEGGGSKGGNHVELTVNYQGGQKLDEAEMHRFSGWLVDKLIAASDAGASAY